MTGKRSKPPSASATGRKKGALSSCGKTPPALPLGRPASPLAAKTVKNFCLTPKESAGTPSHPLERQDRRRQIQSGGRRVIKVSVLRKKCDHIARAVTQISNGLHHIPAITERWSVDQRWTLLLTRLLHRWLGGKWLPGLPDEAALLLSG